MLEGVRYQRASQHFWSYNHSEEIEDTLIPHWPKGKNAMPVYFIAMPAREGLAAKGWGVRDMGMYCEKVIYCTCYYNYFMFVK